MPTILTKRSNTPGAVPATANLTNAAGGAELAVNTADKRLFSINSSSAIIEVGTNPSSLTCADASFTVARVGSLTISSLSLTNVTVTSATVTTLTGTSANITNISGTSLTVSTATLSGGTANGVLYLNGSKVATSGSALTFDGTNFGLGLTPANYANYRNLAISGTTGANIDMLSGSTKVGNLFNDGTNFYAYNVTAGSLVFGVNNTEQMRLTSTGLGIGTSSPAAKLDVSGTAFFGAATTKLKTYSDASYSGIFNGASLGAAESFYMGAGALFFVGGGSERMRLDSSGNLGLGVTPSAWDSSWKTLELQGGFVGGGATSYIEFGQNNFYDGAFKYKTTGAASLYEQNTGSHRWFTAPSGTAGNTISFTQAMTLDASGNLLVGATSAASTERLNVVGGIGIRINEDGSGTKVLSLRSDFAGAGPAVNVPTNHPLLFQTNNTERARITSGGDFGIGTTSPVSRLHVAGNIYAQNSGADTKIDVIAPSDSYAQYVRWAVTGVRNNGILGFPAGSADLVFRNGGDTFSNGTERFRVTSGGDFLVAKTGNDPEVGVGAILSSGGFISSVRSGTDSTTQSYLLYSTGASAYRFYVNMAGTVFATNTSISAISDERLKENICDLDIGLDAVMALKPRKFDWKEGKGANIKDARGFIAQEFEQVFPDLVDEWRDPAPEGEEPYKSVRQDLIPVLVKAIQEQQAMINDLKAKVAALESK
jgi:hypothetical protein